MDKVRVGLIGGGFVSNIHAEAFQEVPEATIVAVCAADQPTADEFARKWKIPFAAGDYRKLLESPEVDMVVLGLPNYLHREVTVAAAQAGKQIVVEKPLAHTLADGQAMVAACRDHKVKLMYAETLCFSPKYARAKQLVEEGAIGKLYMAKQGEKHSGPHSDWFYDVKRSGGGGSRVKTTPSSSWSSREVGSPSSRIVG
jgi:predicted dehydrogenase